MRRRVEHHSALRSLARARKISELRGVGRGERCGLRDPRGSDTLSIAHPVRLPILLLRTLPLKVLKRIDGEEFRVDRLDDRSRMVARVPFPCIRQHWMLEHFP